MNTLKLLIITTLLSTLVLINPFQSPDYHQEQKHNFIEPQNEAKKYDQPDKAAQWLAELRQNPKSKKSPAQLNTEIKREILNKEKIQKKSKSSNVNNFPGFQFENLGPSNFGGRIRGFVINPDDENKLLAGGVNGGIFKSDNAGKSWQATSDFLPTLAIGSMTSDPDTANRVFVGTGEGFFNVDAASGAGIFVSDDFGDSWSQLSSTNNSNFYYVNRLVRVPNSDILVAATSEGLYYSDDLGQTWDEKSHYETVGRGFVDLKINPSNSNHLLAVHYGFPNDALKLNVITPNSIAGTFDAVPAAFGPEFPSMAQSTNQIVLVNDNTATTNDACESIVNDLTGKIALAQRGSCNFTVKVKNAQLAGAVAVIIYQNLSEDIFTMGGDDETITIPSAMISKADGELIANETLAVTGKVEPIVSEILSRFVMQSEDAGSTWNMLDNTNGLPESNVGRIEVAFGQDDTVYVAVANADNTTRGLWRSAGLNQNFTKTASNTAFIERQGWYDLAIAVNPSDSNTVFMGAVDQYITHDGGATITRNSTWAPDSTGADLGIDRYIHSDHHGYFFSPSNSNHHYIVSDGGVYKTENNGQSYYSLNDGLSLSQSYGIAINSDASRVTSGTQDNGSQIYFGDSNSWIEWQGGDGGYSAWDQQDNNYIYGSNPSGGMFGSSDGGANVESINLPDTDGALFIQPFALDPNSGNRMIVGTDNIFFSPNIKQLGNATFTDISGTSSSGSVSALTFNPQVPNQVLYGLSGGALFKIDNVGSANQVSNISPTAADNLNSLNGTITDIKIDNSDSTGKTIYMTRANYDKDRVLKSNDSGQSWQSLSGNLPDIPVFQLSIDPTDPERLFVGTELGLWVATQNGANTQWTRYDYGLAFTRVIDLIWHDNDTLFVGTHGRGTFKASRNAIEISLNKFITTSSTNDNDGILDRGESGLLMFNIQNHSGIDIDNAQFNINSNALTFNDNTSVALPTIPANSAFVLPVSVSLANDSTCLTEIQAHAEVNHSGLLSEKDLSILTSANQVYLNNDFNEDAESDTDNMSTSLNLGLTNWAKVSNAANSGSKSWFASNEDSYSDKTLTSPWLILDGGGNTLSFALKYLTEGDTTQYWDGAVLELREKGGLWSDIGHLSSVPYDGQLFNNNTIQGRFAWSGNQNTWRNATVDLAENYKGKSIQFRFRMTSDTGFAETGFWVDDIKLTHVVQKGNASCDETVSSENKIPATGLWFDRAHNGHGFVIEPVGNSQYFTVFYTYDDLGNPEWYTSISGLENGVLNVNFDANSLVKSKYDFSVDPSMGSANYIDTSFGDGRLSIDFNSDAIQSNAACQDGVARGGNIALARWKINNEEVSWCLEPIIAENIKGFPDVGGTWFAGQNDSGWGFSIAQTTSQLVAVVYYYDADGNPRWLIGQKDNFNVGSDITIDMLQVAGYGRNEAEIPTTQVQAGVLKINLQNALNNLQIDGDVDLNIEYQGVEGGSWIRNNVPIQILSKPH